MTVAADSEEGRVVEEANKRYSHLLAVKAATDKYTDQETQTLELERAERLGLKMHSLEVRVQGEGWEGGCPDEVLLRAVV